MVQPRSRNSVEYLVGVNTQTCANITGEACHNGQAAFWYSQGCFIGCPTCDTASGRRQVDLCGLGKKRTLTDPKYWSVNRDAEPFSEFDIYQHNPWSAPGAAPVSDACGLAGGSYSRQAGAEAGDYTKTKFAQHGDVGTQVLKPIPGHMPPAYKAGGTAEVTWQIRNNHGGGYQYRIAPLPENFTDLKESDFKPLEFVKDQQAIVFPNGTVHRLSPEQTTFVSEGTLPEGSTWSLMPMPPTLLGPCCLPGVGDNASTPHACLKGENGVATCHDAAPSGPGNCAPCPGTPGSDCSRCDQVGKVVEGRYKKGPPFPAPCDGCEGVDWNGYAVKDMVEIPKDLKPGKYILGFRYDCEATAQVWSNCAVSEPTNQPHQASKQATNEHASASCCCLRVLDVLDFCGGKKREIFSERDAVSLRCVCVCDQDVVVTPP